MTIRDIAVAFGFEVDKNSEKQAENSIQGLKNMATKLLGGIAVVFSVSKISQFARDCVAVASNVEEMQNKFDVVFQGMTEEVEEWAASFASAIGRNKNDIKGYLADNQNMFVGMGMTRDQAAALSEDLVTLGLDLASFNNLEETQAVDALSKALMGQSESAKTLGAVLNDNTLAMAMNEMGINGTFQALDEATKMQVRYQAILMQSTDAIGDCERSLNSFKGRQIQLKSSIAELKEFIGGKLLPIFAVFLGWINTGVQYLTKFAKAIFGATEEDNRLLRVFERIQALIKKLQPAFDRFAQTIRNGISRATDIVNKIADKLGGMDRLLKIIGIAAAAFVVAMNWSKIIGMAKSFMSLMSGIGKIFSLANLKIMAVVAIVVVLALIIEDFINFLMGNDSVIGTIFDKAGIGADNARQAIFKAWEKIKTFLLGVWDFLKQAVGMWVDTVKGFFERHGESIRQNFERAWGIIKTFLQGVWTFISQLAATLFGNTEDSIDGSTSSTKDNLLAVWQAILDALSAVWDALYEVASTVFNAVATVIEVVFGWIQKFWDAWGSKILSWFKVLWNSVGGVLGGFLEVVKGVANFIKSVFTGDWQGAWEAIKQIFTGIWDAIVNFITAIWETIKLVFDMALSALAAIWEAIWNGIKAFFEGIWNGIVGFFQGVIDTIMGVISPIAEFFTNIFQNAWDGICNVFSGVASFFQGIWDKIVGIFGTIGTAISDAISGAVKGAINAVLNGAAGIINGFIKAINFAIGIINKIPGVSISKLEELNVPQLAEGGIATQATKAVVGEGSEPEAIMPLSKLGAMISGYIKEATGGGENKTIGNVISMVQGVVGKMSEGVSALSRAATANPATAANATTNNKNSSVVQNVEINNSYSGGSEETQRNVSKAMKKSATDATTEMARGLAYARG